MAYYPLNGTAAAVIGTSGSLVNGVVSAAGRFEKLGDAVSMSGVALQYVRSIACAA